ncbi:MAG: 4'-phosphopantetheinyl transferase superfamily protein [Cyanobacteria bacterium RM1_2_2]|nr:4'-phosphopantetheinyl transferase superfamily protein [Cyanobacteria bacterium RM1_2_2]
MEWRSSPPTLTLPMDEVQIWRANLQANPDAIETYCWLLSPDEQERANRFHFQKDRNRYVMARGILRVILSRYLHRLPQDLQFRYSPTGKPSLAHPSDSPLCFNLSHSGQLALYAVAWHREVGIDVEHIRLERDCEHIAERFFAASEQADLNQLSPKLRHQGFFNGWTRKEAFLKATGQGLTIPLDQIVVSLLPKEPAQILHTVWNPAEVTRWSIQALEVGNEYAAAVVAAGQDWQIVTWQFKRLC